MRRDMSAKEQWQRPKCNRKNNCQAPLFLALNGGLYANCQRLFKTNFPLSGRGGAAAAVLRGQPAG